MNATIAQLTIRGLLGRRRAILLLILPAVLLLLAGLVRWAAGSDPEHASAALNIFALGTIVPLLGLIAGTGAIGPEIDDGSIVYLLSKPQNRFVIVITKVVVAMAVVLAFGAVPTYLAGLLMAGTADSVAAAYGVAAAAAGLAYCALFQMLAVLTRNAVVVGVIYALIWESLIGGVVPGARALSVRQWALALAQSIAGRDYADSAVKLATGSVLLVVVVVGATAYAGWRLRGLRLTSEA